MARHRLVFLSHRPTPWSLLVPVIALVAGLLFATSAMTARGIDLRSNSTQLADVVRDHARANSRSQARVAHLQAQVDRLSADQAPTTRQADVLQHQLLQAQRHAGAEAVEGPGLTVTLDDSPLTSAELPEGMSVDDIVVHQQDVQAVVNALWAGGAEAMMLMDQRVISTSAVRCVGNTLILQGRVYSPPFTIRAIGDPARLRQGLASSQQVTVYREYVDAVGLGYDVVQQDRQVFPAYQGSMSLRYARPGGSS